MMDGYFSRVQAQTQTRFWINNPTSDEMNAAICAGARSCTTNPTYCSRLIDAEPAYIHSVMDAVVCEIDDENAAAEEVYRRSAARIVEKFKSLYESSKGIDGFVTVQGDPRKDDDADFIVAEAMRHRRMGPNIMAKIPAIPAGIVAIERLAEQGVPICATEVFALSQAESVWEAYTRGARRGRTQPPLYVTHITGIFDRYLKLYASVHGIAVEQSVLEEAGRAVVSAQHRLQVERGYPGKILGGGAAFPRHFTDLVGGTADITINWSTADEILKANPPIVDRINDPPSDEIINLLKVNLPPFARAHALDGLAQAEFKTYGPVVLFRNWFLEGYTRLVNETAIRRTLRA